jgi:hypothetical protein
MNIDLGNCLDSRISFFQSNSCLKKIFSFLVTTTKTENIIELNNNDFCKKYLHMETISNTSIVAFELDSHVYIFIYYTKPKECVKVWSIKELCLKNDTWDIVISRVNFLKGAFA